jgi:V8-like Glu-specific endopeptidase
MLTFKANQKEKDMRSRNQRIWAIAAFILGFAAVAFAQDQRRPEPGGVQFNLSNRSFDQASVESYWTAERLASAIPMPLPKLDPATAAFNSAEPPSNLPPRVLPATPPKIAPRATVSANGTGQSQPTVEMLEHGEAAPENLAAAQGNFNYEFPFNNFQVPNVNTWPYSAVGKLFFTIPPGASEPAGNYVCSGSVFFDSHTVITARHCMYDYPTGKAYSNFVFFPAWNNGPNPAYHNGWTVRALWTWVGNAATMDFDIGFLQLNDATGFGCNGSSGTLPIWNYTGSLGAWIFGNVGQYATIQEDLFGYPQAAPFNGNTMFQDEAIVGTTNPNGTANIVELGNPQTGGTSGGPWIVGLDPNSAPNGTNNTGNFTNLTTGLNSFKWILPNQPLAINGPAFLIYNLWNLYTGYSKLPCP